MSKIHKLKINPVHFIGVMNGSKTAEFRINDRNFQLGDILELCEFERGEFTGWEVHARVSDVTDVTPYIYKQECDFTQYVMLSIKPYRKVRP
nr:MAG TPA: activating signal cointegrator [Caudoviricetes sp.]